MLVTAAKPMKTAMTDSVTPPDVLAMNKGGSLKRDAQVGWSSDRVACPVPGSW